MAKSIKRGFAWTAIEKFSIQIVQFILGIIIARHITPQEYGILGILMVFVNISQVFIESGLGSALIYKNTLNEKDLQTAFTFNFAVSLAIVILIMVFSYPIERFFDMKGLSIYLIVCIIVLIFNAFIVVPTSILRVKMNFKAIAISNFFSTLLSGVLGAYTAVIGLGIWALIIQLLSKSFIQMIFLSYQCKWCPKFRFFKNSFIEMYKYAFAIFGTSCITKITSEGISILVAKNLTPYNLGLFTRANQFASLAGTSLGSIFSTVLFPAFSSLKKNSQEFYDLMKKMVIYQGLFIIPLFMFLAVLSKPIVLILLTDKWVGVIPILQILCIGRVLSTISIATEQAICSVGRSDLEFKQQFYKLTIKILFIIIGFKFGIIGIAVADAASTLLSFFITNYFANKCIHFSNCLQLKLIAPFFFSSLLASYVGYYCVQSCSIVWLQLLIGAFATCSVYIAILIVIKRDIMLLILLHIRSIVKKCN